MLGDEDDVTRARAGKEIGPRVEIAAARQLHELRHEAAVGVVGSVRFAVMALCRAAVNADRVPVPLCVWSVLEHPCYRLGFAEIDLADAPFVGWRECRNRGDAPVDKDAEFGILEPIWNRMSC